MSVPPIPDQNGIESARRRWDQLHPKDPVTGAKLTVWDTLAHTLQLLRYGHNDAQTRLHGHDDEIADLERRVASLEAKPAAPFPVSGQRTGGASSNPGKPTP